MQSNNVTLLYYILVQYSICISGLKCTCKNLSIIGKENGKFVHPNLVTIKVLLFTLLFSLLSFIFLCFVECFVFEQAFSCMFYE